MKTAWYVWSMMVGAFAVSWITLGATDPAKMADIYKGALVCLVTQGVALLSMSACRVVKRVYLSRRAQKLRPRKAETARIPA